MKRIIFVWICLSLGIFLCGQEFTLTDEWIEPPQLSPEMELATMEPGKSPVCSYMKKNLEWPESAIDFESEGVVIVQFIVNKNGTVEKISILNPVQDLVDESVVNCIKSTSGKWIPGKINGVPVEMTEKVYVRFDVIGNKPFNAIAQMHYSNALSHYRKAIWHSNRKHQMKRQLNKALLQLDYANKYYPEEFSIALWRSRICDKLLDLATNRKKANSIREEMYKANEILATTLNTR